MSTSRWYAMQHLPAGRCRVRVRWEAREFVAARMMHPKTKRLAWCLPPRLHGEEIVWLPRRADRARWSTEPDCWQPDDAERWVWPADEPAPLPVQVHPQMYSGGSGRTWPSMDEQAVRSARLQEAIEADAVQSAQRKLGSRWWWDDQLVAYSPAGAVSIEEAEARVCRAVLTDGIGPMELPQGWQGVGSALSQFVHETVTSDDRVTFFEPTRRDVTDYETFEPMRWFAALNPPIMHRRRKAAGELNTAQLVIVLHALGYSWRAAGRHQRLRVSHERARQLYLGGPGRAGAIEMIWRSANGQPVMPWLSNTDDPLTALRRRNRDARNRERVV